MTVLELMNRLRSGEINHSEVVRESESLPLEELEKLNSLLVPWKAEEESQI